MTERYLAPCPFCGATPFLHRGDDIVGISCGPDSACNKTGLCVAFSPAKEESAVAAWNRRAPAAGPATPMWIRVNDRLPEKNTMVLCATEFDGPGDWRTKVGYVQDVPDFIDWYIFGGSWTPSHWMPLPAAPAPNSDSSSGAKSKD